MARLPIARFTINHIERVPADGFVSAMVSIEFRSEEFGENPVWPNVTAVVFIPHDAAAPLEKLEAEFLRAARRLMSEAFDRTAGEDVAQIRQEAEAGPGY